MIGCLDPGFRRGYTLEDWKTISYPSFMTDPKEQRLKAIQRRFRTIGARQDFIAAMRRRVRDPQAWVLVFLCAAALSALAMAF